MYNIFCKDKDGYNIQNSIMLPDPGRPSVYHIFHLPSDDYFYALMQSSFDLAADGGAGATLFKNKTLVPDTIHADGLHAVRHANGRDWWIMAAERNSNRYYILLLSPQGVDLRQQSIGEPTWSGAGGNITFSPDGRKMARFNARDDLRVFDFDRCTGELSNPIYVKITDNADNELFAGLAWSADSRYLYAAEVKRMLQFDTWAVDLAASKVIVAERENFNCPFQPALAYLELGPDGRIYGRNLNGSYCMHRINRPERTGADCQLQQNVMSFAYPFANLPHFPNFRLGPVDGSACDTLGLDNHPVAGWRHDPVGGLVVDFTSVSWYEPTAWLWDFGDGQQSMEHNPAHTFPQPGQYDVCLTVSNAHGSDTKCKQIWVTKPVGVRDVSGAEPVTFYPNPSTGEVFWTGTGDQLLTLRVFNSLGQVVADLHHVVQAADLSKLPQGLYAVQLLSQDHRVLAVRNIQIVRH